MSDRSQGRRTLLGTIVAIALGTITGSTAGAHGGRDPLDGSRPGGEAPREGRGRPPKRAGAGSALANRPDAAIGTVDRIVDGRFVVILVEEGGEVVDQTVLGIDDPILPDVSEGDVLLLWFDDEGDLVAVERLERETERRRRRSRDRFADLAEPLGDAEDGREG